MTQFTYNGWSIVVHRQIDYPPYLPWVAQARRVGADGIEYGFNQEGDTQEHAAELCKWRIDESRFIFAKVKLSPLVIEPCARNAKLPDANKG